MSVIIPAGCDTADIVGYLRDITKYGRGSYEAICVDIPASLEVYFGPNQTVIEFLDPSDSAYFVPDLPDFDAVKDYLDDHDGNYGSTLGQQIQTFNVS